MIQDPNCNPHGQQGLINMEFLCAMVSMYEKVHFLTCNSCSAIFNFLTTPRPPINLMLACCMTKAK